MGAQCFSLPFLLHVWLPSKQLSSKELRDGPNSSHDFFFRRVQEAGQDPPKDGQRGKTDVSFSVGIPDLQAGCLAF